MMRARFFLRLGKMCVFCFAVGVFGTLLLAQNYQTYRESQQTVDARQNDAIALSNVLIAQQAEKTKEQWAAINTQRAEIEDLRNALFYVKGFGGGIGGILLLMQLMEFVLKARQGERKEQRRSGS